ncbi:hypothetical protein OXX79_013943, partial [Metschnikowia pulcherrima]
AMELAEWNETATEEEGSASRVSSKINFNDFVMTPSEKKDQEAKDKLKNIKKVDEHESVEVPDLLSAQLDKFKDAA